MISALSFFFTFFFFNDTATTEIYTLSLHDALPICGVARPVAQCGPYHARGHPADRKSTRLNSSHLVISYAVFCLKKKTKNFKLQRLYQQQKNIKVGTSHHHVG